MECLCQQFPRPVRIGDRIGRVLLSMEMIAVDKAIAEGRSLTAEGGLPRSLTI
jgi:hypothetical protein